ncbi:MAG: AAA family ATPase [Deltaproteobacteria bacterium]|nr:AAA family ATPase [Deltaproteobacteria bacterium]
MSDVVARDKKIKISRDFATASSGPAPSPSCNLKRSLSCCGGRGYQVGTQGPLAHASICSCVAACPACLGRARLVEGNHSRPCHTPMPNVVANLINAGMIPARYAGAEVEKFRNFSGNGQQVVAELRSWRSRFAPGDVLSGGAGKGFIIEGPVGVGKTYLLAALAKDFAEKGWSVRFTDFFQLLGELKAGFSQGKADAAQLAPLIDVDVLFIDELGKGRNNDFELTILDQLVCGRYNQNKPIIASTNYKLRGRNFEVHGNLDDAPTSSSTAFAGDRFTNLEQRIGVRIFSRLAEMCSFVELRGDDYRREELRRGGAY